MQWRPMYTPNLELRSLRLQMVINVVVRDSVIKILWTAALRSLEQICFSYKWIVVIDYLTASRTRNVR